MKTTILYISSNLRNTYIKLHKDVIFNASFLTGWYEKDFQKIFKISTVYKPSKTDILYLLPKVIIPRNKLKNICTNENINVTKKFKESNIIICNNLSLNSIVHNYKYYQVNTEIFKKFITLDIFKSHPDSIRISTFLNDYKEEALFIDYYLMDMLNRKLNVDYDSINFCSPHSDCEELLDFIIDKPIYDESDLSEYLTTTDSIIINKESYDQLTLMFNSKQDLSLAMSVMTNCNYSASYAYLLLLLHLNRDAIYYSDNLKNVDFAYFLYCMGLNHKINLDKDFLIFLLKLKNQFNTTNLDIIIPHIKHEITNSIATNTFIVKTITLNEDLLTDLGTNYTYTF